MPDSWWSEALKTIPSVSVAVIGIFAVIYFRREIRGLLSGRLSKVKALGVEAEFVNKVLEQDGAKNADGGTRNRISVVRRSERLSNLLPGTRALLVSDRPIELEAIRSILQALKIDVEFALSSDEALRRLTSRSFDAVICDMSIDNKQNGGEEFLLRCREANAMKPTILTVVNYRPQLGTPPYAFGITNRVDEMTHLVFDIIERSKG